MPFQILIDAALHQQSAVSQCSLSVEECQPKKTFGTLHNQCGLMKDICEKMFYMVIFHVKNVQESS